MKYFVKLFWFFVKKIHTFKAFSFIENPQNKNCFHLTMHSRFLNYQMKMKIFILISLYPCPEQEIWEIGLELVLLTTITIISRSQSFLLKVNYCKIYINNNVSKYTKLKFYTLALSLFSLNSINNIIIVYKTNKRL